MPFFISHTHRDMTGQRNIYMVREGVKYGCSPDQIEGFKKYLSNLSYLIDQVGPCCGVVRCGEDCTRQNTGWRMFAHLPNIACVVRNLTTTNPPAPLPSHLPYNHLVVAVPALRVTTTSTQHQHQPPLIHPSTTHHPPN